MSGQSDATCAIIISPSNSTQWDFLRWMKVLALFLFQWIVLGSSRENVYCFRAFLLMVLFAHWPHSLNIKVHITEALLCWLRSVTVKCVMRILCESHYTIAIRCWFNNLYFELFHEYFICSISRVKWSNPGKGIAPSPTHWCSSYQRGSLWVTLDYSCQLYFYLFLTSWMAISRWF